MTDVMPRVILDELVALAVHQLGEAGAAEALVGQVLAEHPELAAAAVEAPTPAERLQAVDRLFGCVRWAVRERLSGGRRPPATATPAPPPAPPSVAAPAPAKPKAPPWAPSPPPATPAIPRSMAVPPPAVMPKLEPPRTFISALTQPSAEPEAETETEAPAAVEPIVPAIETAPPEPAVDDSPRSAPLGPPTFTAPPRPMMRPRPAPPAEPRAAEPSSPPPAPHRHEPPPLQFEIIDDLYGLEAKARRRRRVLVALATLAVAAGAAWLVVASDLPRQIRGWEWAGPPPSATDGASRTEPPLEALELEAPRIASDQAGDAPDAAPADGTRRILRLNLRPEPAAGPNGDRATGPDPADDEAVRVFIHYDADARSASDAAAALYARLTNGSGYATVVLRDVPYAIGSHRIRYYFPEDRPAAAALAERLGDPPAGDWQLQDFSFYRPQPVRGTLEVFVPTG